MTTSGLLSLLVLAVQVHARLVMLRITRLGRAMWNGVETFLAMLIVGRGVDPPAEYRVGESVVRSDGGRVVWLDRHPRAPRNQKHLDC